MRLAGKRAVVTGASSGIGEAIVRRFAAEGARVIAVARREERLRAIAGECPGVVPCAADVADAAAATRIVSAAEEQIGGIDILVNNAAFQAIARIDRLALDDWDRSLATNLSGPFRLCRAAIPALKASGAGRIINVSSLMGERADAGFAAYAASKAGLVALTRILAVELGRFGITANYILPGPVRTPMVEDVFRNEAVRAALLAKMPLHRAGEPAEIAAGALFLASDESAFMTGQGLVMDGGLAIRT